MSAPDDQEKTCPTYAGARRYREWLAKWFPSRAYDITPEAGGFRVHLAVPEVRAPEPARAEAPAAPREKKRYKPRAGRVELTGEQLTILTLAANADTIDALLHPRRAIAVLLVAGYLVPVPQQRGQTLLYRITIKGQEARKRAMSKAAARGA